MGVYIGECCFEQDKIQNHNNVNVIASLKTNAVKKRTLLFLKIITSQLKWPDYQIMIISTT